MTTPTQLREAADRLRNILPYAVNDDSVEAQKDVDVLGFASEFFRAIADAQSDAGKGFEEIWASFNEADFPMTDDTFLNKEACKHSRRRRCGS